MESISRECCFRTDGTPLSKAVWEITFTCPLKCPYCFQERTGHRNTLSRSQLSDVRGRVLSFLSYCRPKHILLSGGEPLTLGDELFDVIQEIKQLGSTFSLSTTGFPRNRFLKVLDYNPTGINISIDPIGMSGIQYEYRKTKFDTLKETLKKIADRNIPIKGTSIITKENIKNVSEYAEMLRRLAEEVPTLRTIYVANPYHIGYTRPDLSVTPKEVEDFISQISRLREAVLDLRFVNFSSISMPLAECPAARSIFAIVPNGDVVGCPFLYQRSSGFSVGNVVNNSPSEIQEGLTRFASTISKNVSQLLRSTSECANCDGRGSCSGGCFAETFAMKETSIPALLCQRTAFRAMERDKNLVSFPLRIRAKLMSDRPKTFFRRHSLSNRIERKIAERVRDYMQSTFSDIAHRYDHIECVVQLAKHIGQEEGANLRIVVPAAYFHDFAPRQHQAFHFHTDESADAAATFLTENGFDEDEITAIVHCIVASEFSSFLLGIEPKTLEARVVRDADWLEAIGARGIARVFSFAGKHCDKIGIVDFDPKNPGFVLHDIMEPDETPMHHFAAKLLRVNDLLLTKTGRKLGRIRHKFMVDFLLQFQKEMQAES